MKLKVTASLEAAAAQVVLDRAAQALLRRQAADRLAAGGQRGGQLLEAVDARDLLDQVGLAVHVVVAAVRHLDLEVAVRAARRRSRGARGSRCDSAGSMRSPEQPLEPRAAQDDRGAARARARRRRSCRAPSARRTARPSAARPGAAPAAPGAGCSCFSKRVLASLRSPSFLEVWRMLVPFHVAASIATRVVLVRHLARGAAHDAADARRAARVADQHGVAVEDALLAVERRRAARPRAPRARAAPGPATRSRS